FLRPSYFVSLGWEAGGFPRRRSRTLFNVSRMRLSLKSCKVTRPASSGMKKQTSDATHMNGRLLSPAILPGPMTASTIEPWRGGSRTEDAWNFADGGEMANRTLIADWLDGSKSPARVSSGSNERM